MKKQIKNLLKLSLVLSGLSFWSCSDFLDQLPDNRTEIDTPEAVANLLVTAYPDISYIMMNELMSDNTGDLGPAYSAFTVWHEDLYRWEPVIADMQDSPSSFWGACYNAIAVANHALAAIEELGDTEELQPHKGEALLCRAFSHFLLVNVFAQHYNPSTADSELGIPYVTEPETTVFADYERQSVAEVYALIEQDLTEGLPLISNSLYSVPKYHFTTQAANAFASRFYLFKGDWENCITYSNAALGSTPTNYLRDWEAYDAMSVANFLEYYTRSTDRANLMMLGTVSWWGRIYMANRYGVTINEYNSFYAYYDGLHPWGGGTVYSSVRYNSGSYAMKNIYTAGADIWFTPKWDEKFKYSYPGASTGIGYIMMPAFTGEEVLLNRAEAYIMNGQSDLGIADLNLWVNTHVPQPGSFPDFLQEYFESVPHPELHPWFSIADENLQLIQAVLEVRRREFIHEGMRWFDIKRYNFEISHEIYGGETLVLAPDDERRAVQIPQDALNSGIEPNPDSPSDISSDDLRSKYNDGELDGADKY